MERLYSRQLGEHGPRVAFCHGLFGQGRNFTQIARELAGDHRVSMLDLPDHGRSPWSSEFSYLAMADAVAAHLRALDSTQPWQLIGHSMGGKTAMLVALRHPQIVERLVVVDIAPVAYSGLPAFTQYVAGMRALPLAQLTDRAQADLALRASVPDPTVRSFLLQNLRREPTGFSWQMNLSLLGDHLGDLAGWPSPAGSESVEYEGPVLWVAGADSDYITPEHAPRMRRLFPRVRLVQIKQAGHWVHSERPEVFTQILRRFLQA